MRTSITTLVGRAAVLSAVGWGCMLIVDPNSRPESDGTEYIIWPITLVPGVIALVYGIKALIGPNKQNVLRSIGSSIFILAGIATTIMSRFIDSALGESTIFYTVMSLSCLAAVFLYVLVARNVLARARIAYLGVGDLFSKPFVLLFSGLIVACTSGIVQTYILGAMDTKTKSLMTIVNLLAIVSVYFILVRVLGKKSHHSQTSGPKHA